jgi:hypothetical protein
MQTFTTKTNVIAYAANLGWTKADAKLVCENLPLPIDELSLLNIMVRFAGPVMLKRQQLQAAQKGQVTVKNRKLEELSKNFEEMVTDYETQIHDDRSQFVSLLTLLYGFAQKFGYHDDWIDTLIKTYKQHTQQSQTPATKKKSA